MLSIAHRTLATATAVLAVAATAVTPPPAAASAEAAAPLAPIYVEWREGPASHLSTAAERKRWAELSSDAEAEDFIRLFWAQRDPLPATSDNELQREFERRVVFADQQFAETGTGGEEIRGSMSERGRVLILLGPPQRRQRGGAQGASSGGDFGVVENRRGAALADRPAAGDDSRVAGRGGTTERFGVASNEVWVYEEESLPSSGKGARLEVVFRSEPGKDRWELLENPRLGGYLLQAIQGAMVRPDLMIADLGHSGDGVVMEDGFGVYGATPLPTSATQLAALSAPPATASPAAIPPQTASDTHLSSAVFRATDGTWIVPLQVARIGAAAQRSRPLFGELADTAGDIKLAFRLDPGAPDSDGRRFARATLVAPPGDYRLTVGEVGDDGDPIWRDTRPVSVPAVRHELWLSDVVLSGRVFSLDRPQGMLEPWTWQGVMVVPEPDRTFRQGDMLWYYLHVCQPELDEESQPHIQMALDLDGAIDTSGRVRIDPYQVGDDCWVLAQAYDLLPERFPAGDYRLGITVRDTLADHTVTADPVSFTVLPATDVPR